MVRLLEIPLGKADAKTLVCPVSEDFILETFLTRDLKAILSRSLDFPKHRREVKRHIEEGKKFFLASFPEENFSFKNVYYFNVRVFLKKMSFLELSGAIRDIFLNFLEKPEVDSSIAISLLGLKYFLPTTELNIIAHALHMAELSDKRIKDLQISICFGRGAVSLEKSLFMQLFSSFNTGRRLPRGVAKTS